MSTVMRCPQCGATLQQGSFKCEYCKASVFISSVSYLNNYDNSQIQKYIIYYKDLIANNPNDDRGYYGLGVCYLRLSMYPLALKNFEKVIELAPENAPAYYYYCLALIAGRRIRSLSFDTVETITMYLNTSINMDPENHLFLMLMMLIKHDFYVQNSIRELAPTYADLAQFVAPTKIDAVELNLLKSCVRVSDFQAFGI